MDIIDSGRLVTDLNRKKACKRFEIKQLECQLNALLYKEQDYISSLGDAVRLCKRLHQCYRAFLLLLEEEITADFPTRDEPLNDYLSWGDCYEAIEGLKDRFYTAYTEQAAWISAADLGQHYQFLSDIIEKRYSSSNKNKTVAKTQVVLKTLAGAKEPKEWLHTLVQLANQQAGLNTKELTAHMDRLDVRDLQNLSEIYVQNSYINLFNAIFFYKLHPENLFQQATHPEKLLSIKFRLSFIYDFIKAIHHSVSQALVNNNLPINQDYLFQGDMLPPGIEIQFNEDFRDIVLAATKSWSVNFSSSDPKISNDYLQEIKRSYKFWFNPSRLIDAVMGFQRKCSKQKAPLQSKANFYHHLTELYSRMSTSECLDLYGYFNNKDTRYFIRTLLLIKGGKKIDWLPQLNDLEIDAINRSYDALACVMNSLREELKERHIQTRPYKHYLKPKKHLTPGRRNRTAVLRIIQLYREEEMKPNKRIEELFKQLDRSTHN